MVSDTLNGTEQTRILFFSRKQYFEKGIHKKKKKKNGIYIESVQVSELWIMHWQTMANSDGEGDDVEWNDEKRKT